MLRHTKGPHGFKLEQMVWVDDMWCMFMFTNYVFAVLPASALWFSGSNRCTCARVTLLPSSSRFCRMFHCHHSYNSAGVISEDERETNTKESKVHASVRHANCSHANSTVVRVCREEEESLAGQKKTLFSVSPLYSLLQPLEVIVCHCSSLKPVVIPEHVCRRFCVLLRGSARALLPDHRLQCE